MTATSVNVDRIIFTESDLIFIDDYVIFENWDKDKYYSVFRISQDSLKFIGSFLTRERAFRGERFEHTFFESRQRLDDRCV